MIRKIIIVSAIVLAAQFTTAQELLPTDNGLSSYHTAPRYRASESHPLRIAAYVLHPVGWLAREVVFRPFSYLVSSTETTKSVFGFREPFDYRQPECFSADDSSPDCRAVAPMNYGMGDAEPMGELTDTSEVASMNGVEAPVRQVFFPDVSFEFNSRNLSDLGLGRVHQLADLLKSTDQVKVVLQGHADFIGSEDYNEKLGMDRAESVRQELVALGVPADRLATVSFGEAQPIFSEQENWARAVNRRVEVQVEPATVE